MPKPPKAWDVAYLPIDPAHIGRGYQDVVRINSQSGKCIAVLFISGQRLWFSFAALDAQIDFTVSFSRGRKRQSELTSDDVISVLKTLSGFEPIYLALQDYEIKTRLAQ